jgi:hypothetical protein
MEDDLNKVSMGVETLTGKSLKNSGLVYNINISITFYSHKNGVAFT